ncbi:MAG TPA: phosphodiester glycosidase family protein [Lachnospiraceae bacterium]|nr:phosphodiester glycosidase family protein [Lachnospiraceae bacterium]
MFGIFGKFKRKRRIDAEAEKGAYQAWTFGPALLNDDGTAITDFSGISKRMENKNPRSAIGYYEPGHYCLVLVDGRSKGYSCGMTMEELSELFEELGCSTAYNLDGGKSSVMTFQDEIVNQPYEGGRESSDCILIKEAE